MSKVFGSSGRRTNPVGVISILTGLGGAAASGILWIYRIQPASRILGKYSAQLVPGGQLTRQLAVLAGVLGVMAIIASMTSTTGGEGGGGYFIGLILGVVAISYPVMTWLNIVSGPLRPDLLH